MSEEKNKVELIEDSSNKLIIKKLEKMMEEGNDIINVIPLSKTSFLVIYK